MADDAPTNARTPVRHVRFASPRGHNVPARRKTRPPRSETLALTGNTEYPVAKRYSGGCRTPPTPALREECAVMRAKKNISYFTDLSSDQEPDGRQRTLLPGQSTDRWMASAQAVLQTHTPSHTITQRTGAAPGMNDVQPRCCCTTKLNPELIKT